MSDPYLRAQHSASWLRSHGIDQADVLVVAGSGWQGVMGSWGEPQSVIAIGDVSDFPVPTALGHRAEIHEYGVGGRRVLVFLGRTHLYEGHGVAAVVHGVRTAAALGCGVAVITNANGSFRPDWSPGTCMLVRDHLNLTGCSPVVGPRFVDLTNAYSPRLRGIARRAAPDLVEGTYAMLPGPHYETRAEGSMLVRLGADAVGMSMVLETIAAREAGMEVLGLSMVTVTEGQDEIDPAEVVAVAAAAVERLSAPLATVIATSEVIDAGR